MFDFRTILHPTDFSDPAMYAFGLARSLAKESGAELLVAHVAPRRHRPRRRDRRERYEALRRLTTVDPDVRMHPLMLEGLVAPAILRSALELDCDLIVMGTRGCTGLMRLLTGSVTGAVRKDALCPVVAVQLPNQPGWELPEFADEESMLNRGAPMYPGWVATRRTGNRRQEKGDVRDGPMAEEAELVGNRINQQLGGRVRELRLEFRVPGGACAVEPQLPTQATRPPRVMRTMPSPS